MLTAIRWFASIWAVVLVWLAAPIDARASLTAFNAKTLTPSAKATSPPLLFVIAARGLDALAAIKPLLRVTNYRDDYVQIGRARMLALASPTMQTTRTGLSSDRRYYIAKTRGVRLLCPRQTNSAPSCAYA